MQVLAGVDKNTSAVKLLRTVGQLATYALLAGLAACEPFDSVNIYTLYRSSPLDKNLRIQVASFDVPASRGGRDYNDENCRIAAELFSNQPGVIVRYWCEKGHFRE